MKVICDVLNIFNNLNEKDKSLQHIISFVVIKLSKLSI
jgi:hypothetical protein